MPQQEERDTFYEDPIKLVFNDTAIVQLYKAYGKKLRACCMRLMGAYSCL